MRQAVDEERIGAMLLRFMTPHGWNRGSLKSMRNFREFSCGLAAAGI